MVAFGVNDNNGVNGNNILGASDVWMYGVGIPLVMGISSRPLS